MSNLVQIGNQTYQEGDAPQDQEREHVTRNAILSATTTLFTVAGLGTIGVPIVSIVGLGVIGLQLIGVFVIAWDHVESSDQWEALDKMTVSLTGSNTNVLSGVEVLPDSLDQDNESKFIASNQGAVTVIPVAPIAVAPSFSSGTNVIAVKPSFSSPQNSTLISPMKPQKNRPTAVSLFLADPYESRCIFGAQRTGKSYFAAIVSAMQAKLGTRVYHINLASYGTEDFLYWQHAFKSVCCDISSMDTYDAKFQIDKATQLIFDFYSDPNPSILIVDEIAYLGSTGNYHKESLQKLINVMADKITVLSSSGKKRQKAVWTIAPEFVAGAVTQDTKAIKKLTLCYLTIHPEKTVDWEGQDIGFNSSLFDQIKNNYPIFYPIDLPNEDRVAYIGDQWMSIGELPSLQKTSEVSKVDTVTPTKVTLPESNSGSGLTLFQRATQIADSSSDVCFAMDIWELEDTQHEPETIKRLEAVCLESSLK